MVLSKEKKMKLFKREGCSISQTWHLKKHTSGGDFITVIRTFNMKTFCPITCDCLYRTSTPPNLQAHSLYSMKYIDKAIFWRQPWGCATFDLC